MPPPGPSFLGRGLVLPASAPVPDPWRGLPNVVVDEIALADADAREELVARLHRIWVDRSPVVIRWEVPGNALGMAETSSLPPWRLDPGFLFPFERLRMLCFSNHYDARSGEPVWWWARKAASAGASPGGPADVLLPDGTPAWIDGGPRGPLPETDHRIIHGEAIEAGMLSSTPTTTAAAPSGLAPDQAAAATHGAGPARIIAPAGSGKTRTLAARYRVLVDHHRLEARHVVALAYNAKAADELRERLGVDRSSVRTIHSLGWEILREAHPGIELIDEAEVRNVLSRIVDVPRRFGTDVLGPYVDALQRVRSGLVDPYRVEDENDDIPGFAAAFEPFRRRLYDRGRVDHGEQVYGAIEALLGNPELRRRWQRRCRHLLVDEFQDLTPAYLLLIRLLASPELDVFGVGDDDQVIYGYDGADPGFLIDFADWFPGAATHPLDTNYRCPPSVVTAATHLLSHNRRRVAKIIKAHRDDERSGALEVATHPGEELAVRCADVVADRLASGAAPADIAVLARVNAALIPVKAALAELGIATNDRIGPASLDRTTIRALFAWLRIALDPEHIAPRDAREAIRRPHRRLNRVSGDLLRRTASLDELEAMAERLDDKSAERWLGFCDDIARVAAVGARGDAAETVGFLIDDVGLVGAARQLDAGRRDASRPSHGDDLVAIRRAAALHRDLGDLVAWLRDRVATPSSADGVVLSSVHRVKGMEWPHVIVFGADRGVLPHDLADDVEEERRIFHVALTRGIEQVTVLADAARASRFLRELERMAPALEAEPARPAPRSRSTEPARSRPGDRVRILGGYEGEVVAAEPHEVVVRLETGAELAVPPHDIEPVMPADASETPSGPLIEALKAWRLETSRALGVPAYVVLHDRTIEEIARRRPTTERELLAIGGIGARKLEDYGDDILSIVEATG